MTEVERGQLSRCLKKYIEIRGWQESNMPIYGSFIGFDLILFLVNSRTQPSPYSLKDVFHSLNYSEGALRIFIRRLEKDGWITLETWPGDRRNKKIIVTDHLFETVNEFINKVAALGTPIPEARSDTDEHVSI